MISIVAWRRFGAPVGAVIGSVAVDWYGLIVDSIQVSTSPTGLFILLPRRRTPNGRWLKFVRFRTVREEQAFKTEVLAALMSAYPEDFVGHEAAKPRVQKSEADRCSS
jgi:DNA-binding cell septation regulator SpoVG